MTPGPADAVLQFLVDAQARGERTALIVITDILGRSSRAPGTMMAVAGSGRYLGALSGGCVEAAAVAEAQRAIADGRAHTIRFGEGSPFIDIKLPCGGGLDLLVIPDPALAPLQQVLARHARRQPAALELDRSGQIEALDPDGVTGAGWHGDRFRIRMEPRLRLCIMGHGSETTALARQGAAYGADIVVFSPDADIVALARSEGAAAHLLKTLQSPLEITGDPLTAFVLLFHDHDWERNLLVQALAQEALFVGAMGSRITHERRLTALRGIGIAEDQLSRITGPIGLIPAVRDPESLALSTMAQIVSHLLARA